MKAPTVGRAASGGGAGSEEQPAILKRAGGRRRRREVPSRPPVQAEAVVSAGHWIVDPGIAKQSQDWIYVGPGQQRPLAPRRPATWPALAAAVLGALFLALAALVWLAGRSSAGATLHVGPLAAGALYGGVATVLLLRERRKQGSARQAHDAGSARQAWEGEIETAPPAAWPDRPLVVAIGDGVSSALRSAEIARLATQTAWERTFHHLHALRAPAVNRAGAGNSLEFPWLTAPRRWPAAGPERDHLLVGALRAAFADANRAVIEAGQAHRRQDPSETRRTATTLTLLAVDGRRYFMAHVGDCSVYHVDGVTGEIAARQEEHNQAAEHARAEPARYAERYAEARARGLQNTLTRWMGKSPEWSVLAPQLDESPGVLADGDSLVLCSDGVDKHVPQSSVSLAAHSLTPGGAARRLVALANDAGGSDHIAVAVLRAGRGAGMGSAAAWWPLRREEAQLAWQRSRGMVGGLAAVGAVVLLGTPVVAAAFSSVNGTSHSRVLGARSAPPAATWTPVVASTPVAVSTLCQALRWCDDATQRYNAATGAPAEAQQAAERARVAAAAAAQAVVNGQARRSPGLADARAAAERAQVAHGVAAAGAETVAEQVDAARLRLPQAESTDPVAGPDGAAQVAAHAAAALTGLSEVQGAAQEAERARMDAERAAARLPPPTATPPPTWTRVPPTVAPATFVPIQATAAREPESQVPVGAPGASPQPQQPAAASPAIGAPTTAPATRSVSTIVPADRPTAGPTMVPTSAPTSQPTAVRTAAPGTPLATATRQ